MSRKALNDLSHTKNIKITKHNMPINTTIKEGFAHYSPEPNKSLKD